MVSGGEERRVRTAVKHHNTAIKEREDVTTATSGRVNGKRY